jgi:hypothetical protein
MYAHITESNMGGAYMPPAPPSASYAITEAYGYAVTRAEMKIREVVQPHYIVRVDVERNLALDKYTVRVRILNKDWSAHAEVNDVVEDFGNFPNETLLTQVMMVAG